MKVRVTGSLSDNIVPVFLLALFIMAVWMSFGFSPRARLAPLFISSCCVVFVALDLLLQNVSIVRDRPGSRPVDAEATGSGPMDTETVLEETSGRPVLHSSVNAILVVLCPFFVAVIAVGLVPGAMLFIFGYLMLVAKSGVVPAIGYVLAAYIIIELLFVNLLGVLMYYGVFGLQIPYVSG